MKGFAALLTLATVGGLALPGVGRGQAPLLDHLAFDGQDDCVSVPYSASFPSLIFTASARVRPRGTREQQATTAPSASTRPPARTTPSGPAPRPSCPRRAPAA